MFSGMNEELNPSDIGSYEYWNNVYNVEIRNYKNHGDVGEIWFGRDTAARVVNWINRKLDIQKSDSILDLGCGNGMLLIDLYEKGFINLHGLDYCQNAVDLARAIASDKQYSIEFFLGNILDHDLKSVYSVILDKGTYDAISLNPDNSKSKRMMYIKNVISILKENGYFIITSCNWTEAELLSHFNELNHVQTLPAPTFQFGGKLGKTATSIVFKKARH